WRALNSRPLSRHVENHFEKSPLSQGGFSCKCARRQFQLPIAQSPTWLGGFTIAIAVIKRL
ncbi:MAG: hypothetical protein NXI22_00650, partial [bacterium]|nr:hypothetical protein [bacterium]